MTNTIFLVKINKPIMGYLQKKNMTFSVFSDLITSFESWQNKTPPSKNWQLETPMYNPVMAL